MALSPLAMPATPVDASALSGSSASFDLSVFGLFASADMVGKVVMVGLLLVSVFTWALIFDKATKITRLRSRARFFEERFWAATSLEVLYDKIRRPADPMQAVFVAAVREWRAASDKGQLSTPHGRVSVQGRIDRILQVTIGREMAALETWMTFLASVSSVAPFIGLFGTVWGIMRSFIGIAQAQNTSLAVVAPGIAEALLATAVGLVTAIPATAAYNKFSTEIGRYAARLENFANDLIATLSRTMEER